MTGNDWHYAGMEANELEWSAQVKAERLKRGLSKEAAARLAGISSITYKRIEDGLPVRETSLMQVLGALGLGPTVTIVERPTKTNMAVVLLDQIQEQLDEIQQTVSRLRGDVEPDDQ